MKKSLFIALALMATTLCHGATTLVPNSDKIVFQFDYSADTANPPINNPALVKNWAKLGNQPSISNGVAVFNGTGGSYVDGLNTFDVNNFTVSFDIGNVTQSQEGTVVAYANNQLQLGYSGFTVRASATGISLIDATQGFAARTTVLTANIDLSTTTLKSITVINNSQGSFIYSGDSLLASSVKHISWSGADIKSTFSVGHVWKSNDDRLSATLDNVTLYSSSVTPSIPEPATASLALLGALGLLLRRRR